MRTAMLMNGLLFLALSACLPAPPAALVGAFAPLQAMRISSSSTVVAGAATGPRGKPASSPEEDLFLTLRVIMDHDARSATVSREQFISQMREAQKVAKSLPPVDTTVPYSAAAQLAYEKSDRRVPFREFAAKYEEDAIQLVKTKKFKSAATATLVSRARTTLASASRRVWTLASSSAASLAKLGSAAARRLYGAGQTVARKLLTKKDTLASAARSSGAMLASASRRGRSLASRSVASLAALGASSAQRLYSACQKAARKLAPKKDALAAAGRSSGTTLVSASRKARSFATSTAVSLVRLGDAAARKLYGVGQKVVWKIKLRGR